MPVTRVETIGRSLDANFAKDDPSSSITRQYYIHGPADESEVIASLDALPSVLFGNFQISDYSAIEEDEIAGDWHATVQWGLPKQPLNTVEYRFNFTAPSAHISQSLQTISYHAAGESETDPTMFGGGPVFDGAINVVEDGGKYRVEGLDLAPPPETFVLTFVTDNGFVTREYQQRVEARCGHVNEDTYFDCAAGTLLLARVSGGKTAEDVWSIEFGFSFVGNRTNIPVGPHITVSEKDGHDLLWVFYPPTEETGYDYKGIVPRPMSAYVERVWPRAEFGGPTGLGLTF